ncbi:hypothetical protein AAMO2058_001674100 [Amorphochlora amoebiformis]|uniref:SHSP domain-containing protein n=1 Tax=Amorphochlora amoebiformis TaxID=1561963 RepID=A0A7S0H1D6_9EUKA|mmetsp:Transcript_26181/g.41405  ORF Transcript_26181/g.41405 Transcript_26181/m.41405 type:complete len:588 (+) Transcript_26181:61-1824(+)
MESFFSLALLTGCLSPSAARPPIRNPLIRTPAAIRFPTVHRAFRTPVRVRSFKPQDLDVEEKENGYNYRLKTNGVNANLKVSLQGRIVTVEGSRMMKVEDGYYSTEFKRTIALPPDVDFGTIAAKDLGDGTVQISACKLAPEESSEAKRAIPISGLQLETEVRPTRISPLGESVPPLSVQPKPSPDLSQRSRSNETSMGILRDIASSDRAATAPRVGNQIGESPAASISTLAPSSQWEKLEDSWVLRPPEGTPWKAVAHFTGGAFAGAVPQVTYNLFLRALAERGVFIIATPFSTRFDYNRCADEAFGAYGRVRANLSSEADPISKKKLSSLPVFGIGHSLGSVVQILGSCFYPHLKRSGNVLISFNNKPAAEAVAPMAGEVARGAGLGSAAPVIQMMLAQYGSAAANPDAMGGAFEVLDNFLADPSQISKYLPMLEMLGVSVDQAQQMLPALLQLGEIRTELAAGVNEFSPSPMAIAGEVDSRYAVTNNLLIQFDKDVIDETARLETMLKPEGTQRVILEGNHMRPMVQRLPARVQQFAQVARDQLTGMEGGMAVEPATAAVDLGPTPEEDAGALADAVVDWMGKI